MQVLVLGVGAWMASTGLTTVGALAAFQALFTNLCYSLSYTTQYVPTLVQATAGMQRIEELLREPPSVAEAPDAETLPPFAREIALRQVSFGYTPDQVSLRDANLVVPAGRFVALVGGSGSGKSTILNQVMRLYDPAAGAVLFDGRDLRRVALASLRSQMSVVFQDSILFNTTIVENIGLGRLGDSREDIEHAARAAEIHDFIVSQPFGYDTVVGERGGRLSGGQRQRIAIARAILRNPRVLLLDEATSALDPATETAINQTLAKLGKGRTVLAVTHRLASVVHADDIFVLEAVRVIESGRHDELLERRGTYHNLWMKQSGITVSPTGDQATIDGDRVRSLPGLRVLDDDLRESAARLFVTERYPQGRLVITQDDPADRFYVIARGKVEVFKEGRHAPARVAVLHDGDSFGEVALLKNVPRNASVRTLTPCTFLSLQREQFAYLLSRSPQLREYLEHLSDGREPAAVA